MIAERYPGLLELPDEDKLSLMVELWRDVVGETPTEDAAWVPLIEHRLRDYEQNPQCVRSWSEVKERIRAARR